MLEWGWVKEIRMMKFFSNPHFPFVKVRRFTMSVSLICIIVGMAFFCVRGKKNLAQDFTGGLLVQVSLTEPITMADARAKVKPIHDKLFTDLDIQSYGQSANGKYSDFVVRTARLKDKSLPANDERNAGLHTADELRTELSKQFSLQKNGLIIGTERIKEKSSAALAAFKAGLSLKTAANAARRTAPELKKLLEGNTTLKNLEVGDNPDGSYTVFAGLPLVGADGIQRTDTDIVPLIRDQIQRLRDLGILDFTEPFPRFNNVGAAVAGELISSAVSALIFALMVIFVYIWLRFQFRADFGFSAVLALAHDVFFCLGLLAILDQFGIMNGQIGLTVVAALLTLVGYSLNDTIVVFDRIRECLRTTNGMSLSTMVDDAVNQTLSRTVITSVTTLLVVVILLFEGGEVLRGFSFVMLVGVVVGTYSSVFIAAPLLIEIGLWKDRRREAKAARLAASPAVAAVAPVSGNDNNSGQETL